MSTKDLILAIDNGTQSLKAIVFDDTGTLLAKEQVGFEPYFSKQPGWAEQDPEVFWDVLCQACQSLWKQDGQTQGTDSGRNPYHPEGHGHQCRSKGHIL